MNRTESQREKAADAFAEMMQNSSPEGITKFKRALVSALEKDTASMFGCYNGPDTLVKNALRKAKLPLDAITGVVIVAFESGDKIRAYHDGNWSER